MPPEGLSFVAVYVQVLEVPSGERNVGGDDDLALTLLRDHDGVAQVTDAVIDLDLLVQELLESVDIEDLVVGRLGSIDGELSKSQISSISSLTAKTIAYLLGDLALLLSTGGFLHSKIVS